jgi:DNA polymerase type B, organellar and viral
MITPDIDNTGHILKPVKTREVRLPDGTFVARSVFDNNYIDYVIHNDSNASTVDKFFEAITEKFEIILNYEVERKTNVKSNTFLVCIFNNINDVTMQYVFKTQNSNIFNSSEVEVHVQDQFAQLFAEISNRELNGSGWNLFAIQFCEIRISKVNYLPGGDFTIKIPKWISDKKATVNVSYKLGQCFKYCILVHHALSNGCDIKDGHKFEHLYNFNIRFPVRIGDLSKFCTLNNLSLNVLGLQKNKIFYPLFVCRKEKARHINLLYLENSFGAHYVYIKNLSRLLSSQVSKRNGAKFFCNSCLLFFHSQERLDVHKKRCDNEKIARVILPKAKTFYRFKKFEAIQLSPLICSFDMESLLLPIASCAPQPDASFTNNTHLHTPLSFGAFLHSNLSGDDVKDFELGYFGFVSRDEVELEDELVRYFIRLAAAGREFFSRNHKIKMTNIDYENFRNATHCHICGEKFDCMADKVKDHLHYSYSGASNFRGAAHAKCNILLRQQKFVPIYTQNIGRYDYHHMIKAFSRYNLKIKLIPHTTETVVSFSVYINHFELRFLDSLRLLSASLDTLSKSLPNELFYETKKQFPPPLFEFLSQKGPFPYTFMSDYSALDHKTLPERHFFDNDLSGEKISDEDFDRAKKIWVLANCKTMEDYLKVYQSSDSFILHDILTHVRKIFWDKFSLDACFFLSLPHLSMNCMLKYTGIKIELFSEGMCEEFSMVTSCIYGGMAQSNTRFVEAGGDKHLFLTDCTSLYPHTYGSRPMPVGGYKFVAVDLYEWTQVDAYGSKGYLLEVDLHYPVGTHDYLNCLPPLSEHRKPDGCTTLRMLNDLTPKTNYVVSLPLLQLAIKLGAVCTKIWRVLEFDQKNFLGDFVKIMAGWRKNAKSEFESGYYKLFLNGIFGKLIENLFKRRNMYLVNDPKHLEKLLRKGNFVERHIYNFRDCQMVFVELAKSVVTYDRPLLMGSQILSLSKVLMLEFWYFVLKKNLEQLTLAIFDTDGLCASFISKNPIEDLKKIRHWCDFSSLPEDHPLYSKDNSKEFGYFKDEAQGKKILGICSPRTKVYAIRFENAPTVKKLKGIKKSYVKSSILYDDYKDCVLHKTKKYAQFKNIIANGHNLYTANINKLALEGTDRKRFVCPDGIHTLAFGHYKINEIESGLL